MDDELGVGGLMQQWQQQVPTDWTQSDNLRLQRMNAGLSTVQQQVDEGVLSPEDGAQLYGQVQAMRQPLVARQAAAARARQQKGEQRLQEVAAMQAAMDHSERVWRAAGFRDLVASYTDPETGQTTHMVEDGKGKWQPIDFSKASNARPEGSVDYFPPALAMTPNADSLSGYYSYLDAMRQREQARQAGPQPAQGYDDANNPNHQLQTDDAGNLGPYRFQLGDATMPGQEPYRFQLGDATMPGQEPRTEIGDAYGPVQAPGDAAASAAPAQPAAQGASPQVQPAPDGGHVMTIQNGPNVERWHFSPDGKTTLVDAQGPRYRQAPALPGPQLSPQHMAAIHQEAVKMAGPPPQITAPPNTPLGRLQYEAQQRWANHVRQTEQSIYTHAVSNREREQLQARGQQFREAQQRRAQEFQKKAAEDRRQAAAEDRRQAAAERQARADHYFNLRRQAVAELTTKDEDGKPVRPKAEDIEARVQEIEAAHQRFLNPGPQISPQAQQRADLQKTLAGLASGGFGR